jgi:hypothetical protein
MSQPNQPPYGQSGQPQQPNQYGQPAQPDQYGQQYAQPGQPNQYGQQYAQPGQPNQYGQQPGQFIQPQSQYSVPGAGVEAKQQPGSLGKALVVGLLAVVLGALAWGGLVFLTERIFVYVAFAIGYGVSYALTIPFRKPLGKAVIVSLLLPAIVLTVASVELGNYLSLVFAALKLGFTFSESLTEAGLVFSELVTSGDGLLSAVFGLIGAAVGFFNMIRR